MFSLVEPHAGAIALLRYRLQINSTQLVEKLLHEKSVLIVPGDHFGMDNFLRLGYGPPEDYLRQPSIVSMQRLCSYPPESGIRKS